MGVGGGCSHLGKPDSRSIKARKAWGKGAESGMGKSIKNLLFLVHISCTDQITG